MKEFFLIPKEVWERTQTCEIGSEEKKHVINNKKVSDENKNLLFENNNLRAPLEIKNNETDFDEITKTLPKKMRGVAKMLLGNLISQNIIALDSANSKIKNLKSEENNFIDIEDFLRIIYVKNASIKSNVPFLKNIINYIPTSEIFNKKLNEIRINENPENNPNVSNELFDRWELY